MIAVTTPTLEGVPYCFRVRAEPARNTKNAAQLSRKSSHPSHKDRTNVKKGVEFLISVVDISSLSSEYKPGV
jgi:hypothetical protein